MAIRWYVPSEPVYHPRRGDDACQPRTQPSAENSSDLLDSMIKWPDNSDASAWYYLAVQEATNSHYYKAKENKFEKWSELRDTRDWTELEK